MADNVDITAGSGTTVATDDCTTGHVQLTKLAYGADGNRTHVPADADGLLVNLGTNNDVTVSGVSTAANQSTIIGHLDGVETLLGTIDADTATLAGAVSSAKMQVDVITLPSVTIGGGGVAHDTGDSGNPVKIGLKAESSPAGVTLVTDGDRTDAYGDVDGIQLVKPFTAFGDILVERVSNTDGSSTASTVFGATANARNCITTIAVYNDSTTNGYIDFRDGTGGTILFTLPLPAKGGAVCNFPLPLRQTTTNTALAFDVSAALTTVYISLIGFKSKA
jgi:hypothetical protein